MAKRTRTKAARKEQEREQKAKAYHETAPEVGDWLEDILDTPALGRWIRVLWNCRAILEHALEAIDHVIAVRKTEDKLRRTVALAVTQLGGPAIDWEKQATKDKDT